MTTANATASAAPKPKQHVIRTLGKSLREYKKASLLSPAFVAVESVLEILIPTVMASLIDEGISGGSMPAILKFTDSEELLRRRFFIATVLAN